MSNNEVDELGQLVNSIRISDQTPVEEEWLEVSGSRKKPKDTGKNELKSKKGPQKKGDLKGERKLIVNHEVPRSETSKNGGTKRQPVKQGIDTTAESQSLKEATSPQPASDEILIQSENNTASLGASNVVFKWSSSHSRSQGIIPSSQTTTAVSNVDIEKVLNDTIESFINHSVSTINDDASIHSFAVRGLVNSGSVCFMNAILQCLFSITSFTALLQDLARIVLSTSNSTITQHAHRIYLLEIVQLAGAYTGKNSSVFGNATTSSQNRRKENNLAAVDYIPQLYRAFKATTGSVSEQTSSSRPQQEDAMEFLTFVLDALHEEYVINQSSNADSINENQDTISSTSNSKTEAECDDDGWNQVTAKSKLKAVVDDRSKDTTAKDMTSSYVSKLFHGTLRSEVTYKLKKTVSVTFQKFHCITLPMSRSHSSVDNAKSSKGRDRSTAETATTAASKSSSSSSAVSIESLIDSYFQIETIVENEIKKQIKVESLPQILVLHLGRFYFDYRKNIPNKITTAVEYPLLLEIGGEYLSSSNSDAAKYRLSAVALHHGSKATGGHYSCYCKDHSSQSTQWKSVNDIRIANITEEQALSAKEMAYLLFYSKV